MIIRKNNFTRKWRNDTLISYHNSRFIEENYKSKESICCNGKRYDRLVNSLILQMIVEILDDDDKERGCTNDRV